MTTYLINNMPNINPVAFSTIVHPPIIREFSAATQRALKIHEFAPFVFLQKQISALSEAVKKKIRERHVRKLIQTIKDGDLKRFTSLFDPTSDLKTPFLITQAILSKKKDIVRFLLSKGEKINGKDKDGGWTPLHYATIVNAPEIVQLLLDKGANAQIVTPIGFTAKTCAKRLGFSELSTKLAKYDNGHSKWWNQFELLTLIFGFKLNFSSDDQSKIEFKGSHPKFSYSHLTKSLKQYGSSSPKQIITQWSQDNWKNVTTIVENGFTNLDNIDKICTENSKDSIYAFPLGWEKHSTGILIQGDVLIKCDRGNSTPPGMHIYKIGNRQALPAVLKKLSQLTGSPAGKNYFNHVMDHELKLKEEHYIKTKKQKSGNCSLTSAHLVLRGAIYLKLIQKNYSHADAVKASHDIYHAWDLFDRERAIENFLQLIKTQPEHPLQKYVDKVLFKVLTQSLKSKYEKVFDKIHAYKPSLIKAVDQDTGDTLLHTAVDKEDPKIMCKLLDMGIDVNAKNKDEETPLYLAVSHDKEKACEFLISEGADTNAKDKSGISCLHAGILPSKNSKIIKILLENKADPDYLLKSHSPLTIAVLNGDLENIDLLLKYGAKTYHKDTPSPLISAIMTGDVTLVQKLLDSASKVFPNSTTPELIIAQLANNHGFEDIVKAMEDKGFKIPQKPRPSFLSRIHSYLGNLYNAPSTLIGSRLIYPLKSIHHFFQSKGNSANEFVRTAWKITHIALGIFSYPLLFPLAAIGIGMNWISLKINNAKAQQDLKNLVYAYYYPSFNQHNKATTTNCLMEGHQSNSELCYFMNKYNASKLQSLISKKIDEWTSQGLFCCMPEIDLEAVIKLKAFSKITLHHHQA